MNIDIYAILQAFAALICTLLTAVIIPFIRGRVSKQRLEQMQAWARIAVLAAEQLFVRSGRGWEKKAYAMRILGGQCKGADTEVLSALVECAVNTMNCNVFAVQTDL